ncbi:MAG TPA: hypothetical protein VHL09_17310 [Dehalococcoidia bacterium]|nr:hypothetical protein [Dehalococcoidia bacterium]
MRPARGLTDGEEITTGRRRFRYCQTPHLPHGWDAGLLFEETSRTLFCSDLFHQLGDVEPLTESDVIDRARQTITEYQGGLLASYQPYTTDTDRLIGRLADLRPEALATMHGSVHRGDGARALRDLGTVIRETAQAATPSPGPAGRENPDQRGRRPGPGGSRSPVDRRLGPAPGCGSR